MKITLNKQLNLKELFTEQKVRDLDYVGMSIGYDGNVYMLFSSKIPPRIDGMFVDTAADSEYTAVVVTSLWESGAVDKTERIDLGHHKMNFHFIRPVPGGTFLLLGSRCMYSKKNGPERNAVFVDREGTVLREYTFGDGIADCIVRKDGVIFTSYFDEGVIGNYGWDEPIGSCGVCAWNADGEIVWRSERDIIDCYAMNLDKDGNLWYYYYTDFCLVRTDLTNETEYDPQISGADIMGIAGNGEYLIMNGGYGDRDTFHISRIEENQIKDTEPLQFVRADGTDVKAVPVAFNGEKGLVMDWNSNIWFVEFTDLDLRRKTD